MYKIPKWKVVISLLFTLTALAYAIPNFTNTTPSFLPKNTVNLGLDLRGGSHLLLDVDFDVYLHDTLEILVDNIRKQFRETKIGYKGLKVSKGVISFELRDEEDSTKIKKAIRSVDPQVDIVFNNNFITLQYSDSKLQELKDKVIEQSIEIIRMRIDSTGTKEPIIQKQGDNNILLQVPGEENPEHLKNILGKTAKLTFHLVDETADISEAMQGHVPAGDLLVAGEKESSEENSSSKLHYLVIKKKVLISGDQLKNAQATFNQNSQPVVSIVFNALGGKLFAEITKNNQGKRLAIVLDNKLLCAPSINEPILGGSAVITGNFTVASANELALFLRAGALPAPLKTIEERSIGPSLGADSIESGKIAGIIGFVSVVIFMILSYGILGIFANIALVLALLYILALLSILQATLTLPGIAGIILTIGMAVDANVLIYERIREELKNGASNVYAIKQGFETAFTTIADSNITTLIIAFLLYIFGIGAIKGFAVTLTIGIISSMFSAIVITKLLVDMWIEFFKPKNLGL